MRFSRKLWMIPALLLTLLVSGCVSLAGDITPPPNYVPAAKPEQGVPAGQQPVADKDLFPIMPPDPAQGAAIYAEKCLPCHGASGMGDGPQAANLPNPAAPIGSAEFSRKSRPVDWFRIVTEGNLQKFMPGFSESLNDRQRWDVVAYVYTLSTSKEELTQGKTLYEANCAECHGVTGKGDGAKAASLTTKPVPWTDQARLADNSADTMVKVMVEGAQDMPAFADKLDENQRYAVASYIRSLSFASDGTQQANLDATPAADGTPVAQTTPSAVDATIQPGTAAPNGTANPADQKITVSGKVSNATPGGKLPEGMKVTLLAYQGMSPAFNKDADVAADGSYKFENVDFNTDFVYFISVAANGLNFNSDILHASDIKGGKAEMPVKIYDASTDASVLRSDRLHVFFDFSNPGTVQVVNLYIISNPTDKVVVAPEKGKAVVTFELPEGATNLQFQDGKLGERYLQTDKGFGDTSAVAPGTGQHQILFAYELPYTNNKLSTTVKAPLPVDAAVVMVPPGVKLKSDQLTDAGQQDVQGMSFQMYQAGSSLKAGDTISLSLSGSAAAPGTAPTPENSTNYLLIGAGGFGLALVGVGLWFYMRSRRPLTADGVEIDDLPEDEAGEVVVDKTETSESLLDAIVALDDLHASGTLPEAAYQERRAELKSRLGDALQREKKN